MPMNEEMCRVNRDRVRVLVRERELKFWWVAEQVGVHKTTLRRWLSGRIKRAHEQKVAHLAQILNTEVSSLTLLE